MLDIFTTLLNTLFPKPASVRALTQQTEASFLTHYNKTHHKNFVSLASYSTPEIKAAITANKFHDHPEAAILLGHLIKQHLAETQAPRVVCIPIPLSARRATERGYNQVLRILSTIPNIQIVEALVRTKDTVPQTSLARKERLLNVQGVFAVKAGTEIFTDTHLLIIDDVVTTGATLAAARTALLPHTGKNCKISCVACAH